jgi:hypothetical protein
LATSTSEEEDSFCIVDVSTMAAGFMRKQTIKRLLTIGYWLLPLA